jgi:hypothetical protein
MRCHCSLHCGSYSCQTLQDCCCCRRSWLSAYPICLPTPKLSLPCTCLLSLRAAAACLASGTLGSFSTTLSRNPCSQADAARSATYQGTACGPNKAFVQWQHLTPSGCSTNARSGLQNVQQQAEWLGQCGVPPYPAKGLPTRVCGAVAAPPPASTPNPVASPSPQNPSPSPSQNPYTAVPLGRATLLETEIPNWGMGRVGAYDSATDSVVDAVNAIAVSGAYVITIDTGCDRSHPDLHCSEVVDLVDSSSSAMYGQDGNGHGTHVAGEHVGRSEIE